MQYNVVDTCNTVIMLGGSVQYGQICVCTISVCTGLKPHLPAKGRGLRLYVYNEYMCILCDTWLNIKTEKSYNVS